MADALDTATLWLMKLSDAFRPPSEALLNERLARAQSRGREAQARYLLDKGANPDLLSGGVPLIVKAAHDRQP